MSFLQSSIFNHPQLHRNQQLKHREQCLSRQYHHKKLHQCRVQARLVQHNRMRLDHVSRFLGALLPLQLLARTRLPRRRSTSQELHMLHLVNSFCI